jgi:hypothetical protein
MPKTLQEKKKRTLKVGDRTLMGFRLIPDSSGIILNGIYVKDDNSEIIIKSAFGGQWHFKPLNDNESSL